MLPPPPLPSYFLLPQKSDDALLSQFSKPKQKRHRCRNPNKIDINTLTGEERVPVVNRRNGRKASTLGTPPPRQPLLLCIPSLSASCTNCDLPAPQMGGAMAPPMKELPRWLLENPEYSIAPDWTDIVKQSVSSKDSWTLILCTDEVCCITVSSSNTQGFLPEAMFDRLLTGPVVREEGVRRRGRRPKSEIAKAAAAAQATAAAHAAQASAAQSAGKNHCVFLSHTPRGY